MPSIPTTFVTAVKLPCAKHFPLHSMTPCNTSETHLQQQLSVRSVLKTDAYLPYNKHFPLSPCNIYESHLQQTPSILFSL